MVDEELDAALVERVREATFGKPTFYTEVATETLRVKRALLSLPIPAAALNALARGEAVVALPGTMPPAQVRDTWMWQRGDTIKSEMWVNEGDLVSIRALAASPYAAKE